MFQLSDELPPHALRDLSKLARVDSDVDHYAPHLSVPGDVGPPVVDIDDQARDADALALTSRNTRSSLTGWTTKLRIRKLVTPGATQSSARHWWGEGAVKLLRLSARSLVTTWLEISGGCWVVLVGGWEVVDEVLEVARARCCFGSPVMGALMVIWSFPRSAKSSLSLVCQMEGGLLAVGTCGSEEHFSVDLDGEVDWFFRFLMTVLTVKFSVLSVHTCCSREQTTFEIFLADAARMLIFFARL